jgi:hypothetical protein
MLSSFLDSPPDYKATVMKKAAWFFWALVGFVWLFASLPFSEYSVVSLFDVSKEPPSSREELQKLLEDIVFSANVSVLSVFLLYGMKRRWYLRDDYPRWLRALNLQARFTQLFGNSMVFSVTNLLLALLGLISSILFALHLRVLGRGLGYW